MDQTYPYTLMDILRLLEEQHSNSPETLARQKREQEARMRAFYQGLPNPKGYDLPPLPGFGLVDKQGNPIRAMPPKLPLGYLERRPNIQYTPRFGWF